MLLLGLTSTEPDTERRDALLERCLAGIARGEKQAVADLYTATSKEVFGFSLSLLKSRQSAEDVMQEVYLKIWEAAGGYRPQGKPMAWILTIARNLSMTRLREQQRVVELCPEPWAELSVGNPLYTLEDRLVLEAVFRRLTDEERHIVTLYAVAGLKHREIADLLVLPLPTVLSKYQRARKKLKRLLEGDTYEANCL